MLPHRALLVVLIVSSTSAIARAESEAGSTLAPDGTRITRQNYPQEWALRPLVSPKGLLTVGVRGERTLVEGDDPLVSLSANYGFGHGFSLSASGLLWDRTGGRIEGFYQLHPNFAVNAGGTYYRQGSPDAPTRYAAGWIAMPTKFVVPGTGWALGGFDELFRIGDVSWRPPQVLFANAASRLHTLTATAILKLWAEYSFQYVTLAAGGAGYVGYDLQRVDIAGYVPLGASEIVAWPERSRWSGGGHAFASVNLTFRHVDAGVGVVRRVYFESTNVWQNGVWTYVSLRI